MTSPSPSTTNKSGIPPLIKVIHEGEVGGGLTIDIAGKPYELPPVSYKPGWKCIWQETQYTAVLRVEAYVETPSGYDHQTNVRTIPKDRVGYPDRLGWEVKHVIGQIEAEIQASWIRVDGKAL